MPTIRQTTGYVKRQLLGNASYLLPGVLFFIMGVVGVVNGWAWLIVTGLAGFVGSLVIGFIYSTRRLNQFWCSTCGTAQPWPSVRPGDPLRIHCTTCDTLWDLGDSTAPGVIAPVQGQIRSGNATIESASHPTKMKVPLFLLVFTVVWSVFVLFMDYGLTRGLWAQGQSSAFVSGKGGVLQSSVKSSADGESHEPLVLYAYSVNDRRYEGCCFRFTNQTRGYQWCMRYVAAHPPGSEIAVFYDPSDPGTALLNPGLTGRDLMLLLFLMPFNVVMVGLCAICILMHRVARGSVRVTVRFLERGLCHVARMPGTTGWIPAGITLTLVPFIAFLGLEVVGGAPSKTDVGLTFLGVLAAGFFAYQCIAFPVRRGSRDMEINPVTQSIVLPWHRRSQPRVNFTFKQLRDVKIEQKLPRPFAPMEDLEAYVVVYWVDSRGTERSDDVLSSGDENDCRLLVEWITSKISSPSQSHTSPNVPRPSGRITT